MKMKKHENVRVSKFDLFYHLNTVLLNPLIISSNHPNSSQGGAGQAASVSQER